MTRSRDRCERCGSRLSSELVRLGKRVHSYPCAHPRALVPGQRVSKYSVSLDEETHAFLAQLGEGNLSAGVRMAAARLMEAP